MHPKAPPVRFAAPTTSLLVALLTLSGACDGDHQISDGGGQRDRDAVAETQWDAAADSLDGGDGPDQDGSSRADAADAADATDATDASDASSTASCRLDQECAGGADRCVPPGESIGCGTCRPSDGCSSDDDCTGTLGTRGICEVPECSCDAQPSCMLGCADAGDCKAGQICGSDHRCAAAPCADAGACPEHFTCDSSGHCARKNCTTDVGCAGGACVNGACYSAAGTCSPLPP